MRFNDKIWEINSNDSENQFQEIQLELDRDSNHTINERKTLLERSNALNLDTRAHINFSGKDPKKTRAGSEFETTEWILIDSDSAVSSKTKQLTIVQSESKNDEYSHNEEKQKEVHDDDQNSESKQNESSSEILSIDEEEYKKSFDSFVRIGSGFQVPTLPKLK